MDSTDNFKKVIAIYLEQRSVEDPLFALAMNNEEKNIDDCITYILNTIKKSGAIAFTDEEVFKMAVHYYDEKNIEVGEPIECNVVSNHAVTLTDEEIRDAKEKAKEQLMAQERARLARKAPKKAEKAPVQQSTLF